MGRLSRFWEGREPVETLVPPVWRIVAIEICSSHGLERMESSRAFSALSFAGVLAQTKVGLGFFVFCGI
jgi:hypothetical protein